MNIDHADILAPPPGDLSVSLLDSLFGPGWHSYLWGGAPAGAGSVLAELLGYFNVLVLAGVAVTLIIMTFSGVIGTSHEGTPLGKKYHSIWVPMRGVTSITLLTPVPWAGGFSILQAATLAVAFFGIGFASTLWSVGLDYMEKRVGDMMAVDASPADNAFILGSLETLVVRRYLAAQGREVPAIRAEPEWVGTADPSGWDKSWSRLDQPESGQWVWRVPPPPGSTIPANGLGAFFVKCADRTSTVCETRKRATFRLISELDPIAEAIVSRRTGTQTRLPLTDGAIRAAKARYLSVMREAVVMEMSARNPARVEKIRRFVEQSKADGWISAGGWYWNLAKFQEVALHDIRSAPTAAGLTAATAVAAHVLHPPDLANLLYGAEAYLGRDVLGGDPAVAIAEDSATSGGLDQLLGLIGSPLHGAIESATEYLTQGDDPIARMQAVGSVIIDTANVFLTTMVAARAAGEGGREWSASFWGQVVGGLSGGVTSASVGAAHGALEGLWPIITGVFFWLLLIGALLAFWLPAIPLVQWWIGAVAWLIMFLEVLIAAPLWAATHASPDGEGVFSDGAKKGYMLFLRVLLTPALMVLALFIALTIFVPLSMLLGGLFKLFLAGVTGGGIWIIGAILYLSLLALILIGMAHRIFGLVSWLPETILNWLGQLPRALTGDPVRETEQTAIGWYQASRRIATKPKPDQEDQ